MTAVVDAPVETVEQALARQKREIIDRSVRQAREAGWCEEFERNMRILFPEGSGEPDGGWYDSDGWPCRGNRDRHGYTRDGYDRTGFNRDGWDQEGRDRDGWDAEGFGRDGFNADGLTREGWTRESPEYLARFQFSRRGFNREGVNARGVDPWGDRQDRIEYAWDADGHHISGAPNMRRHW